MRPIHSIRYSIAFFYSSWRGTLKTTTLILYEDDTKKSIATTEWVNNTVSVEINLKNEETITFDNIPYGVTYKVEENNYTAVADGGYDAASYDGNENGTIASASVSTTITNNKSTGVDTGISLDSIPYVLTLAVVCAGAFVFFSKKRAAREN